MAPLEHRRPVRDEHALDRQRMVLGFARHRHAEADEDVEINRGIGRNGLAIIEKIAATKKSGEPVNLLTHCNAGWLATVDWGTALAPIYQAHNAGIPIHVWVDETRPRNQGAALTCWELAQHGVPHTLIADNAAGLLLRRAQVDIVLVGADRVVLSPTAYVADSGASRVTVPVVMSMTSPGPARIGSSLSPTSIEINRAPPAVSPTR